MKKNPVLIPFPLSDFWNTTTLIANAVNMGKPILPNKAIGPGIIPIPNIGGSFGMSTKPAMIIHRYKTIAIN